MFSNNYCVSWHLALLFFAVKNPILCPFFNRQLRASFSQSILLQFWKSQCPSGSKYPELSKTPPTFAFWIILRVVMVVFPKFPGLLVPQTRTTDKKTFGHVELLSEALLSKHNRIDLVCILCCKFINFQTKCLAIYRHVFKQIATYIILTIVTKWYAHFIRNRTSNTEIGRAKTSPI